MKKTAKIILIAVSVIIVLVVAGILVYFIFSAVFAQKCAPLTPLALQKFKTASQIKPIEGEKCSLSQESYFLKIDYDDDSEAEKAKAGLEIITEGKRKEIGDSVWIENDGDSSVFFLDDESLIILVAPDIDEKDELKKLIDKIDY